MPATRPPIRITAATPRTASSPTASGLPSGCTATRTLPRRPAGSTGAARRRSSTPRARCSSSSCRPQRVAQLTRRFDARQPRAGTGRPPWTAMLRGTAGPRPRHDRRLPTRRDPMDAIALLKADHDKVKELLDRLEKTTERGVKTREELFATIKGELTLHEIVEEEIFYPELKAHPKAEATVLEGFQEHHVVDLLMGELEQLPVDDETWGAKAKVMKENIEHHIEEEEGEMFRQARQAFDKAELDDLGRRMTERKQTAGQELGIPVPSAG